MFEIAGQPAAVRADPAQHAGCEIERDGRGGRVALLQRRLREAGAAAGVKYPPGGEAGR